MGFRPVSRWALLAALAGCGNTTTPTPAKDMAMMQAQPDMTMQQPQPDMAMPPPCDPVKQDCMNAGMPKCAIVDDGSGMGTLTTQCLAETGMKMLNDTCTRTGMGAMSIGMDDCAKGLFCSGNGPLLNPVVRHCKQICGKDGDCTNSKCLGLTQIPPYGICIAPCTVFGTDCGSNTCASLLPDVDGMTGFFQCRMAGGGAVGASCMANGDLDCAANMICTGQMNPVCTQLCDASHTCPNGKTCKPIMGVTIPNNGGICQ